MQALFVEQSFPYNTYFNTKQRLVHYFFFEKYITKNYTKRCFSMILTVSISISTNYTSIWEHTFTYSRYYTVFYNIIFQYTNHLPFGSPSLHTFPMVREHLDPYVYYIRYKPLAINKSQNPFKIIFNTI